MNAYRNVFELLKIPEAAIRCAVGDIRLPVATLKAAADWYGFPPALIPIWSDGSGPTYIGILKHWFCDREVSFVKMYVGAGRETIEIARTVDQLFGVVSMMSIGENDGITDRLSYFANQVGLHNLLQIDAVSLVSGDEPKGLALIEQFNHRTPFETVLAPELYTGKFPTGNFDSVSPWWNTSCSFEVTPGGLASLALQPGEACLAVDW